MFLLIEFWFHELRSRLRRIFTGPPGPPGCTGAHGRAGKDAADIECPHCRAWLSEFSERDRVHSRFIFPALNPALADQPFTTFFCGNCSKHSDWFTGAPVLIRADMVTFNKPQADSCISDKAIQ